MALSMSLIFVWAGRQGKQLRSRKLEVSLLLLALQMASLIHS
jgi:hypothetical protein